MSSADLRVNYCGLQLANPIVVAPAAITETADHLRRCEDAGAAGAVMKSYFEFEPARRHATPRFRVIRHGGPLASRVLYSFEQASVFDLQGYCEQIRRGREVCSFAIFASLNCNTPEHWQEACAAVEQAGAQGIELNVSCPHGTHIMGGQDIVEAMVEALTIAREATSLPVVPKVTPQLARPDQAAVRLEQSGAAAVVMFNRFTGLDININSQRPILHGGYAGHGGPWALHYLLRWLTSTYPHLSIPIAASGGVFDAEGAVKALLAGATVVQTCSAVVIEGYSAISRLISGLAEYLDSHGYSSLDDIRGIVCDRLVGLDDVDRRNRVYAVVGAEKCTACGLCRRVCIYDAIEVDETAQVDPAVCDGCGLCAELCPVGAISLEDRPEPLDRPLASQ